MHKIRRLSYLMYVVYSDSKLYTDICIHTVAYRRGEGGWGSNPSRNPEILTKMSRISSSVENTSMHPESLTKSNRIANSAELLNRGLPPPDPRSLFRLSSTEFFEPPPNKIPGYATEYI
jgi:hypothetical protein